MSASRTLLRKNVMAKSNRDKPLAPGTWGKHRRLVKSFAGYDVFLHATKGYRIERQPQD